MKVKKAIVKNPAHLLGTDLTLEKGDIVLAFPATNIPEEDGFFCRPPRGKWRSGIKNINDSILFHRDDLEFRR